LSTGLTGQINADDPNDGFFTRQAKKPAAVGAAVGIAGVVDPALASGVTQEEYGGRRLLYPRADAAYMLAISLRTLDHLMANKMIRTQRIYKQERIIMRSWFLQSSLKI
jgi:hypothetical protein